MTAAQSAPGNPEEKHMADATDRARDWGAHRQLIPQLPLKSAGPATVTGSFLQYNYQYTKET
jgi:hypothetical protein